MKVSRQTLKEAAPWAIHAAHLWRRAANQIRYPVIASTLEMQACGQILGGPFKGLRAPHCGISPGHYTQMLGLYETALTPAIEAVIARQPAVIVDVGSHWGYYALGLAMRCPQSRVLAYEMDRSRAQLLRRYSVLNGLGERVELRGACTVESLASELAGLAHPFLLMDVEGAEDVLLDPVRVPQLRHAEIIVELHEAIVPGVTSRLRAAFAPTHREALLHHQSGAIETVMTAPIVKHRLLRRTVDRLMDEGRETAMSWLHLQPLG